MADEPISGSDLFRRYVGDRAIQVDPMAHAIFKMLMAYEQHHHREHGECENEARTNVVLAMRSAGFMPTLGEALAAEEAEDWLKGQRGDLGRGDGK